MNKKRNKPYIEINYYTPYELKTKHPTLFNLKCNRCGFALLEKSYKCDRCGSYDVIDKD